MLGKTSEERSQSGLRGKKSEKSPESKACMCKEKCGPFGESKGQCGTSLQSQMASSTWSKENPCKERENTGR